MSDFISNYWGIHVSLIALGGIVFCVYLLWSQRKVTVTTLPDGTTRSDTGHVYDEDLRELNNPLPRWWMWMYLLSCVFAVLYLLLFPGLGSFGGWLGYTSVNSLESNQAAIRERLQPVYARFETMSVEEIAQDDQGRGIGQRFFLNNCATCHGSDARGSRGFPNLADKDWLYGGAPEQIIETITNGRHGIMPPQGDLFDSRTVSDIAHYVRSLSGLAADPIRVARGKEPFTNTCAACHGAEGEGNQLLGAPRLNDRIWLYGSSEATIVEAIMQGRDNQMPAHNAILAPEEIKMVAAYVWGLSNQEASK
ncbi:MAG: cytochrome-c oxidase, cbb3-type subunit III [Pigmentiphaga sp.]|nr:cytochrome-c oxidase, cbb3-type subunit III [Pigmentiphaga sp.]